MAVARQLAALLGFSAALLLLTCSPPSEGQQASPSVAQAQGEPLPARIDFYLPPARITPPAPRPLPVARPHPASRSRTAALAQYPSQHHERTRRVTPHAALPVRRQGLFTVARTGGLLYRKGYLGDIPVHLVVANLHDPQIKLGLLVARAGIGSTESFASMVRRAQPAAAITGTFFGIHNGLPTGDLVVNGHAIYQGFVGTAIAFTRGNLVSFIRTRCQEKTAWRFFDGVMRAGPMLVQAGQIVVGPHREGFVSLSAAARRPRTAVGITPGDKLLLLAVKQPISLWRLAKLMRALGAYHAVAMDGGSSTGLYFHGRMVARPARALTNALVIYANRPPDHPPVQAFHADGFPAAVPPAPPSSPGPALVLRVQPVGDHQTGQAPREATRPAAALISGSAATPGPEVLSSPAAASSPARAASPASSPATSGPLEPAMPGMSTPSPTQPARSPATGGG